MTCGDTHAMIDAGPFGALHAGHSHSDTLSMVLRSGNADILIDPGTYTYTGEPEWRDWFRGTRAHNTICIDGRDQAVPRGPFRWDGQARSDDTRLAHERRARRSRGRMPLCRVHASPAR
jgi:uncharacterized heparinase superfamily protein